jgi:hypothetical protein
MERADGKLLTDRKKATVITPKQLRLECEPMMRMEGKSQKFWVVKRFLSRFLRDFYKSEDYAKYMEADTAQEQRQQLEARITAIRDSDDWGDHLEWLMVSAHAQCNIVIYSHQANGLFSWHQTLSHLSIKYEVNLHVFYVDSRNHYALGIPTSQNVGARVAEIYSEADIVEITTECGRSFQLLAVKADGHCMFRTVAAALFIYDMEILVPGLGNDISRYELDTPDSSVFNGSHNHLAQQRRTPQVVELDCLGSKALFKLFFMLDCAQGMYTGDVCLDIRALDGNAFRFSHELAGVDIISLAFVRQENFQSTCLFTDSDWSDKTRPGVCINY